MIPLADLRAEAGAGGAYRSVMLAATAMLMLTACNDNNPFESEAALACAMKVSEARGYILLPPERRVYDDRVTLQFDIKSIRYADLRYISCEDPNSSLCHDARAREIEYRERVSRRDAEDRQEREAKRDQFKRRIAPFMNDLKMHEEALMRRRQKDSYVEAKDAMEPKHLKFDEQGNLNALYDGWGDEDIVSDVRSCIEALP